MYYYFLSNYITFTRLYRRKVKSSGRVWFAPAGSPGEGGSETYSSDRILPHVKLKKCVRRFWARGVSDRSQIEPVGSDFNQNAQKATDMTGGSVPRGERGELI